MKRYAEGTTVSVESSRAEISGILAKHGVLRQGWFGTPDGDELIFELHGGQYRLRIEKPTAEGLRQQWIADGKPPTTTKWLPNDNQVAAEWRRRWRANVLLLKAKLEFAAGGDITTVDRELMAYRVLADGRTLGEALSSMPLLEAGEGVTS